jgi:uncharacterized protein involved in exopolysaccharide biosynthesis
MTTPYEPDPLQYGERFSTQQLLAFLRRMLRAWPYALIAIGVGACGFSAYLYFRSPAYRSETVLLYSQGVGVGDPEAAATNPRNASARLKEVLMSRPKLAEIVTSFSLYPELRKKYGMEDAVEELKRHIEFRAPGGDTFSIAYHGGTPAEAQAVTRALARAVIDGDAALRKNQAELALDFLTTERAQKTRELKDAEQRLATFMGAHRRFALDATPLVAGAAIRATAPAGAPAAAPLGGATLRSASTSPVAAPMTRAGAAAPAPDAEERARALAGLAAARANLADQLRRYTPAHPDVRAAQGEVERATARVAALGPERPMPVAVAEAPAPVHTASAVEPPRPVAAPRAAARRAAVSPAPSEDVVGLETEWAKLTREVTTARQRLDQVEAELFKADVVAASERAGRAVQISVIDPAFLPQRPIGPAPTVITAVFLAIALAVGLLVAGVSAVLDDRVYGVADLAPPIALLAEVPKLKWGRRTNVSR